MLEMLGRGVLKSVCQLRPGPKSFAFGELRPDRFVLGLELDSWADVHHEFRISRGTRARWASGRKQRSQPCPALHSKTSHGPDLATAFHRMPCLLARRKGRIDPATLPKASKLQLNQSYKCLYRASAGLRLESDSFRAWEMPPRGGVVAAASASQPGATLYNHSGLWQRQSGQCWHPEKLLFRLENEAVETADGLPPSVGNIVLLSSGANASVSWPSAQALHVFASCQRQYSTKYDRWK